MRTLASRAALRRPRQERSARPPATCSSYYLGYSFLILPAPPAPSTSLCVSRSLKNRGAPLRSQTLHDHPDSHRGRQAPAQSPPQRRTETLARNERPRRYSKTLYCSSFKLRIVCPTALLQPRARGSSPIAEARDVSGERSPNVIGRTLSCSSARKARQRAWCGVFPCAAQGPRTPSPRNVPRSVAR